VGSTTTKAVILGGGGEIVATALIPALLDPEASARAALAQACAQVPALAAAGAAMDGSAPGAEVEGPAPGAEVEGRAPGASAGGLARLVGTGYGRNEVPFAAENVSEITCHGVGAHHLDPTVRSLVDIGGQDVKAIALHPDGTVREFVMNDKCAAGTGRFFEAMARTFQCSLEELSALSLGAGRAIPVSSQCSVFAESEVISLLAARKRPADIAAGIHAAVAKRVSALGRRVGLEPALVLTGGCAKNAGLLAAISKLIGLEVRPLPLDPQLVGALGAALLAKRRS
jgi:predicted CoA-substrate-specific enzyme activase